MDREFQSTGVLSPGQNMSKTGKPSPAQGSGGESDTEERAPGEGRGGGHGPLGGSAP